MTTLIVLLTAIFFILRFNSTGKRQYARYLVLFVILVILFKWTKFLILFGVIYFIFLKLKSKRAKPKEF